MDIRAGDCLASDGLPSLADGAVDVCITDPPFDAHTHAHALKGENGHMNRALPFAPLNATAPERLAGEFARVTRRWIVVFCADRQIETWAAALERVGARYVRTGVAVRQSPRPQLSGDRPAMPCDWIVIAHASGGRMRWNGGGRAARWTSGQAHLDPGGHVHPTQKPLDLMRALVEDFTDAGELVCDPFAGSGTTAVACKELGRRFVGWELDPGYHAAGLRRIEDTREQLRLDVAPPAEQGRLF